MDRNSLAQTLVRFYIAHNATLPLLDCLISREVFNVSQSNVTTLFRGNSLASKCLDQFMKVSECVHACTNINEFCFNACMHACTNINEFCFNACMHARTNINEFCFNACMHARTNINEFCFNACMHACMNINEFCLLHACMHACMMS